MPSITSLRHLFSACVLLAVLAGCGGGGGGGGGDGNTGGIGDGVGFAAAIPPFTLTSKSNGSAYPIDVYLPASYKSGSNAYPVIYVTDGDDPFSNPGGTRFQHFRTVLEKHGTQAILVGVGNSAQRQTDYNFPGATAYYAFLTQELIPVIEAKYRSDANRRMLTGLSTGGSFVLTSFLTGAPDKLPFSYYLSSEAAIWQQAALVDSLEEQLSQRMAGKTMQATLILAHSAAGGNSADVIAMYKKIAARNYQGLALSETSFPFGHAQMDAPAFEDAVTKLFP